MSTPYRTSSLLKSRAEMVNDKPVSAAFSTTGGEVERSILTRSVPLAPYNILSD